MRTCRVCKKEKELAEFYEIKVRGKKYIRYDCKNCFNTLCNKNGRDIKRKNVIENREYGIKKLGGKCTMCGYDYNPSVLVFHHPNGRDGDPERKISALIKNTGFKARVRLDSELDKCVLLCSNCHMDFHYPNSK